MAGNWSISDTVFASTFWAGGSAARRTRRVAGTDAYDRAARDLAGRYRDHFARLSAAIAADGPAAE